ncbi:fibrinogen-like protein A [Anopheles aquasalis]|uniref:fibrinogen-like protein A n=1 Tax=Anopheles aquasalis TaxID=42839 RepID=UPI00215AC585|nr:fibrinogen-like protein A [Anopheles aquasalis]
MKIAICMLLFCGSTYAATTTQRPEDTEALQTAPAAPATPASEGISGTVLEKLFARFDQLDRKLLELQNGTSKVERKLITIENTIQRLEQDVGRNMSVISSVIQLSHVPDCVTSPTSTTTPKPESPSSCKEIASNVSAVYFIRVKSDSAPIKVYCEMEKFDGGWIVLQHRFNGSVNFFRNWADYRDGFGEMDSEFWLGLKHVHQLTDARPHELIVEVKDFSGNYGYARYSAFHVGSASEHFRLNILGSYSGTAGDSLIGHKGRMFCTKDQDNDGSSSKHYAVTYEGPWWHVFSYSNLNGRYKNTTDTNSIWWYTLKDDTRGLSFSRMMVRQL